MYNDLQLTETHCRIILNSNKRSYVEIPIPILKIACLRAVFPELPHPDIGVSLEDPFEYFWRIPLGMCDFYGSTDSSNKISCALDVAYNQIFLMMLYEWQSHYRAMYLIQDNTLKALLNELVKNEKHI